MTKIQTIVNSQVATMTSLQLLDLVNDTRAEFGESQVRHGDFAARCRDELDGEYYETFVVKNQHGPATEAIRMTADQCKLVAMRESKGVRRRVLARLNELEAKVAAPLQPPVALPDFTNPAIAARAWAEQFEAKEQAQQQLAIVAPKAQALDRIAQAEGDMCITDAAKDLGMKPRTLMAWLEQNRWVYRRGGASKPVAYQDRIQSGHLTHKVTAVQREDGTEKMVAQVIVTPKGLAKLAEVAA